MTKICNMFVTLYICKKIVKTVFINKKDKKNKITTMPCIYTMETCQSFMIIIESRWKKIRDIMYKCYNFLIDQ